MAWMASGPDSITRGVALARKNTLGMHVLSNIVDG